MLIKASFPKITRNCMKLLKTPHIFHYNFSSASASLYSLPLIFHNKKSLRLSRSLNEYSTQANTTDTKQRLEFQAETKSLLDIVAKSLYSDQEVCVLLSSIECRPSHEIPLRSSFEN